MRHTVVVNVKCTNKLISCRVNTASTKLTQFYVKKKQKQKNIFDDEKREKYKIIDFKNYGSAFTCQNNKKMFYCIRYFFLFFLKNIKSTIFLRLRGRHGPLLFCVVLREELLPPLKSVRPVLLKVKVAA